MPDYHRVVDEIRSFLNSNDQTYNDSLRKLAVDYAEACAEVNQRLRRCEEFLQRGLRSEAIQYAQTEPVLLDVLAALDFPERGQWEELALLYGLPPPQRLRLDTAEALNRAYVEEQPLEQLMRQHRRLALARAPLKERLAALRQIAQFDAGNPVWADDVVEFEKARLQEMQAEMTAVMARNDIDSLARLWEEIQTTPWSVPPSSQLMNAVNDEVAKFSHVVTRRLLENAAVELAKAYAANDEARAVQAREEWYRRSQECNVVPNDPLNQRVAPALKWLHHKERRNAEDFALQTAIEKLELALQTDTPAEELEGLYYAVKKFKRSLPEGLRDRYHRRRDELQQRSHRFERMVLTATWCFGILMLIILVLLVAYTRHS
jgi:hypothetical protein